MNKKQLLVKSVGLLINFIGLLSKRAAGKRAFELFSSPRKGQIQPKDEAFLKTAHEQQGLDTKVGRIQAYSWNETGSRSILLLHGWESNSARWQLLIKALVDQNFKVIAIDAPAHGASEGKQINMPKYGAAIAAAVAAYQPQCVVGHSLGGASTSYYLANYAHPSINKVVLMGAPSELTTMINNYVAYLGFSTRVRKGIDAYVKELLGQDISSFSAAIFGQQFKVPALIIHDEQDAVIPVESGHLMAQHLSNAQLMVTDGLGHSLQDSQIFEAIIKFMNVEILTS